MKKVKSVDDFKINFIYTEGDLIFIIDEITDDELFFHEVEFEKYISTPSIKKSDINLYKASPVYEIGHKDDYPEYMI